MTRTKIIISKTLEAEESKEMENISPDSVVERIIMRHKAKSIKKKSFVMKRFRLAYRDETFYCTTSGDHKKCI